MEQIDFEELVQHLITRTKLLTIYAQNGTDDEYKQAEKDFQISKKLLLDAIERHCHNIASAD